MDIQERFEEFYSQYVELKRDVRRMNPRLYERWKAGGFLIDPDILSMYPHLGAVVEKLAEEMEEKDVSA